MGMNDAPKILSLQKRKTLWNEKIQELKKPDVYGYIIEDGIIETVAALQLNGINTVESDEGDETVSPYVRFEAPEPKDVYVGEKAVKEKMMKDLDILPGEIDPKNRKFDRRKQVEIEEGARIKLLEQKAPYSPEFKKWQKDTLALVNKVQNYIDDFYKMEPIPDERKDLKIEIEFPYRTPNHRPYIHDTPYLRVTFRGEEPKFTSSKEKEETYAHMREEMKRFTEFLKEKYFSQENKL
jgi:hypothetical protein